MRVSLHGVVRSFGARTVLDHVDLTLGPRSRLGLVGPNGAGKSTLLRLLAGLDEPDEGRVERTPASLTVGYLPQEHDRRPGETLLAYLARRTGVADAEAAVERHSAAWRPDAYAAALERFLALGGADLEPRARATCAELGLSVSLDQETATLSGGEAARAGLAAILLARFDVLLLDEPTNDLDFDGLDRLERFVDSFEGGLAVVSHDRVFLDRTATRIAEIDPWTGRVHEHAGGWSDYAAARELARQRQYAAFADAQERRHEVEALLHARRNQARAGGGFLAHATGGSDRRGTKALSGKVRQAERLLERIEHVEKPYEPWRLHLSLAAAERPGDRVASLEAAVGERGDFRLGPIDLDLARGERVAVTGRNGSGKSTLLALLLGELPLAAGRRTIGRATVVGTLDQRRQAYDGNEVLLDAFTARAGLPPEDARTLLAKFNLAAEHVLRPCKTLSPGERTRAHLAELTATGVNCLVLDEPTNHLDLEAIEELETALRAYEGTLVVVSHDRRFLEAVAPTRSISL
ncbi:MAG TPA: ABC-F family ATP-binding cassette domain-containing protein [Gaiellaceae bacterium]|nr:ABC-F family ATP-binding cassette domain-containing protein [Gaiellaceae bacterium]